MNKSFLMMNLSLGLLLFGHISFGMDKPNDSVGCSSQFPLELQLQIFVYTDNKASFQGINKDWNIRGSIKNPDIFSKDFCDIMYAKKDGLQRMCGILLYAAYRKNHEGVENILKNSEILDRFENRIPLHYISRGSINSHVLHPWGIFQHNQDIKLSRLLTTYKVSGFRDVICRPTDLKMACIAGESDTIINLITVNSNVDNNDLKQVVKLLIDFDHSKCLTALLSSCVGTSVKKLFEKKHLEDACQRKNVKVLDVLLGTKCFDINKEEECYITNNKVDHSTLLDRILKNQTNNEDDQVILILKQHGAKTAAELAAAEKTEHTVDQWSTMKCVLQ